MSICIALSAVAQTGEIRGTIIDKSTGEPIVGAAVGVVSLTIGAAADVGGNYIVRGVPPGTYTLRISFLSYKTVELTDIAVEAGQSTEANVAMEEATTELGEVVVTARRRMNTEVAMISAQRIANLVVSGVSSQQITRTQDRDAAEVMRRIPGITIIENRFIIARGLSQRYNNVWVNNTAIPSSEADSRAFSYDMIPSGQIENLIIAKSPAPELPADFTGAFVKVTTKSVPEENSTQISYGINMNTETHFRDFNYAKGSPTDFLGFDNGFRGMRSVVPSQRFDNRDRDLVNEVTSHGFNNNWAIRTRTPICDHRFSAMFNRFARLQNGRQLGVVAALNYSYSYHNIQNMTNARFGIYNKRDDEPTYDRDFQDDVYTTTAKVGGMLNLTWKLSNSNRLEFRNIFNQQGRDRYTFRDGWHHQSSSRELQEEEYLYSSRSTYAGQLSGVHSLPKIGDLDWIAGYSYANRNQPDRREINREKRWGFYEWESTERQFTHLNEHAYSTGLNFSRPLIWGILKPTLKAGTYAEYRSRDYRTRYFAYSDGNRLSLPSDFWSWNISEMMRPEWLSADKFYIGDATDNTNNYKGANMLASGYAALNVPYGKFNIYAGVRYEYNLMQLTKFTHISTDDSKILDFDQSGFFPSVNATYNINQTNLLRFAYGKTINRPEFREVSPSSYYDFELFSYVRGNENLKHAYIQNFDLRYEIYPSANEMLSFALFYKKFTNPIEWTFRDNGGKYIYIFENADRADNYGVEVDVRKNLDFIGFPNFSLAFNGALIQSQVKFSAESLDHDRPMHGQSPYVVNTGLFYQRNRLSAAIM
ncbi:MAG: TonB-dependent receptor, partial [Bacteroidales bacterium]|nr:TonB-dependent receptor [Bacteroidales bacterium]